MGLWAEYVCGLPWTTARQHQALKSRELAILALGAASGAAGCMKKLEGAVGPRAAGNIAEFFADEWEIEG